MNIQPGLYDAIIKYGEAKLELGMELATNPFSANYKDLMDRSSAAFKRVDQCILDLFIPKAGEPITIPSQPGTYQIYVTPNNTKKWERMIEILADESPEIYMSGAAGLVNSTQMPSGEPGMPRADTLSPDVGTDTALVPTTANSVLRTQKSWEGMI